MRRIVHCRLLVVCFCLHFVFLQYAAMCTCMRVCVILCLWVYVYAAVVLPIVVCCVVVSLLFVSFATIAVACAFLMFSPAFGRAGCDHFGVRHCIVVFVMCCPSVTVVISVTCIVVSCVVVVLSVHSFFCMLVIGQVSLDAAKVSAVRCVVCLANCCVIACRD